MTRTAEEQMHLDVLAAEIRFGGDPAEYDAAYFRWQADRLRDDPFMFHDLSGGPDASDLDAPSAKEMDEQADAVECGMYRDEWL